LKVKGFFMRIGEVAHRSGLSPSRIRFYERNGLIPAAVRSENGYRDYPASILETLNLIDQAQGLGFTLEEIGSVLAQAGRQLPSDAERLLALRDKLMALDQHLHEIVRRRQRIVALIDKYER
jgi:MerR family transcriptional regulator, copper efflux regulator